MILLCPECEEPMSAETLRTRWPNFAARAKNPDEPFICKTLVGYESPEGHNHDDNCESLAYFCAQGHLQRVSRRASCPACTWRGRRTCFCHKGTKVDEWPDFRLSKNAEITEHFSIKEESKGE